MCIQDLKVHEASINNLKELSNGNIASCSGNEPIKIWTRLI
jgi:hypothetical protein